MKRLYIGGLGHTVSEKDLKDRFGKFGDVSDVEIITRKDEHGSPLKTFGYININITDAEYKRCIGVLNKSTWKGGTLLIQLAKESFLHRLAEERQQLVEMTKTPKIITQEKLVDSLKAAGVENFHMKAAVPGTEIPEHKDWVVSKFGRVLPVLNLKCKGKNKIFRYDPSKHCHNIKRLEAVDDVTSVSKLTWELEGGDDEISKKRRGEFPEQKPCPKRSKVDLSLFLSNLAQSNKINAAASENKNKMVIQHNGLSATKTGIQRPVVKRPVCVLNDDDSEDEIRMLVAQEHSRDPKQISAEDDDDNLEVVGDDFVVKSNAFWGGAEQDGIKSLLTTSKDDEDYDSADTDEILTQRKTQKTQLNKDSPTQSSKNECSLTSQLAQNAELNSDYKSVEEPKEEIKTSSAPHKRKGKIPEILTQRKTQKTQLKDSPTQSSKNESSPTSQLAKHAEVISDYQSVEEPKEEIKTSSAPPKRKGNNPEDILASLFKNYIPDKTNKVNTVSLPAFVGTKDLFEGPEPILRSVTQSIDCKSPKRLKQDLNLKERTVSEDTSQTPSSIRPSQQKLSDLKKLESQSSEDDSSSEESESDKSAQVVTFKTSSATRSVKTKLKTVSSNSNTPIKPKQKKVSRSSSSDSESSEEEENEDSAEVFTTKTSSVIQSIRTNPKTELKTVSSNSNTPIKPKQQKTSRSSSSDSSSEESETSDEEEKSRLQQKDSKPADSKKVESRPTVLQSTFIDAQKYQKDNQKRLAALEQRQKETEQQKKLIQGALSSVDTLKANKGKHIVFDSDEEEENTTNKPEEQPASQKKTLFEDDSESDDQQTSTSKEKESKKPGGNKLFDSEDEDDGAEDDLFRIKPQFEGKAGQKLMKLQARFGTDSRFQIDSRFLESDNETEEQEAAAPEKDAEQLLEEKKKSLDILQSILKTSIQPQNTKKSKTFKDVSSLHYDPTLEEHAAFESKTEQPKKESKAARRKKREEAEKLPEVSKDIYFEVSADLKEVFGTSKDNQDEKETVSWDKEAEETEDIMTPMEVSNAEVHEDTSGGFKFSFFDENAAADTTTKTDEYKIEMLKGAKFSWQADPRFQDSSSDEEGMDEVEEDQSASSKITEEPTPSKKNFFFFYQGDERLKEGPGMFYRSVNLGDQREAWEEKRTSLREECRKKHRDAKRRERPSLKSSTV